MAHAGRLPTPSMKPRLPRWLLALCLGATLSPAQVESPVPSFRILPPEQTIELGIQEVNATAPNPEAFLARIQPGTRVTLTLADYFGDVSEVTWWRNGIQIANTGATRSWLIEEFSAADNGSYNARFNRHSYPTTSGGIILRAIDFERAPLLNLSTRVSISAETPEAVVGFVVGESGLTSGGLRGVLIRGIGPSLTHYGVSNALPDPRVGLRYASTGNYIGVGFPQIVYSDGTTPESRYFEWVRRISAAVGAFPIDLYEPGHPRPNEDAWLMWLSPGAYTVTLRSASDATGEALIEVYSVSESIASDTALEPPPYSPGAPPPS